MQNIRNTVTVSFKKKELNLFRDEDILSLDVNDGLSIPFVAQLSFITERRLSKNELKSYLQQSVEITVKQCSNDYSVARHRTLLGIVSSLTDNGKYQQGMENSQRKDYFSYELTVVPEIVKLSSAQKTRSFPSVKVEKVISDIFSDYGLHAVTGDSELWEKNSLTDDLILTQTKESDFEFINRLSRAFGLNYSVVYNKNNSCNDYIFSRGFTTDKGSKVFQNSSGKISDLTGQTMSAQLYSQNQKFFDSHCIDDIKSTISAGIGQEADKDRCSFTDKFLTKGVMTSKIKSDLEDFYFENENCLVKSLNEKVLINTADLSFVPGVKFSVTDYSDDDEYLVIRTALNINTKNYQVKITDYDIREVCLALKVDKDTAHHSILGSLVDIQRISERSSLKDILSAEKENNTASNQITEDSSSMGALSGVFSGSLRFGSKSNTAEFSFVEGYVCDKSGHYADYKKKESGKEETVNIVGKPFPFEEDISIPTKFYLKTDDCEQPLTVFYINQSGNHSDLLSFFPRVGQRALALKEGNQYYFYGYLPDDRDIDIFNESLRNSALSGVNLLDFSKGKSFENFDMNQKGLDIRHFDNFKDRLCYMILNDDMDRFMLGCTIRFNDITVYEDFLKEKVKVSSGDVCIKDLCEALPSNLSKARNEYRYALDETGNDREKHIADKKQSLENTYDDLKKAAEKILDIIDSGYKSGELRSEKYFKNSQTTLSSDSDLKISANNDLEITAKNITLNATGKICLKAEDEIDQVSEKKIELSSGNGSFTVTPASVEATIRQIGIVALPYDSDITLSSRGLSVTAVKSDISTLFSATMSDAFGAEFIATQGGIKVYGNAIALETPDRLSLISGWTSLVSDMASMIEQCIELTDNKGAKCAISLVPSLASAGAKIFESVRKQIVLEDGKNKEAVDMTTYICGCVINACSILESAYECVESIVVAGLDEDDKYIVRERKNNYISPKDWVNNAFFYIKNIACFVSSIAATISSFKDNKESNLKIAPTKIVAETNKLILKPEEAFLNNSPLSAQTAVVKEDEKKLGEDGDIHTEIKNKDEDDPETKPAEGLDESSSKTEKKEKSKDEEVKERDGFDTTNDTTTTSTSSSSSSSKNEVEQAQKNSSNSSGGAGSSVKPAGEENHEKSGKSDGSGGDISASNTVTEKKTDGKGDLQDPVTSATIPKNEAKTSPEETHAENETKETKELKNDEDK